MKTLELKDGVLGIQHLLAMFGSTVLVPLITGFSPSVALFTAGLVHVVFSFIAWGIDPNNIRRDSVHVHPDISML